MRAWLWISAAAVQLGLVAVNGYALSHGLAIDAGISRAAIVFCSAAAALMIVNAFIVPGPLRRLAHSLRAGIIGDRVCHCGAPIAADRVRCPLCEIGQ